jgi:hypothetical protein
MECTLNFAGQLIAKKFQIKPLLKQFYRERVESKTLFVESIYCKRFDYRDRTSKELMNSSKKFKDGLKSDDFAELTCKIVF